MTTPITWQPSAQQAQTSALAAFAGWLGFPQNDYRALWDWSVTCPADFWTSVWSYFGVGASPGPALGQEKGMPGTQWFPNARVNYAAHLLQHAKDDTVAIRHGSELRETDAWTWRDLRARVREIRGGLMTAGVIAGDRVAAYMPNAPDTVAALLATASLGAIWTAAAPEFGSAAVVDRFRQVQPAVLLATDGYRYDGKDIDCSRNAERIASEIGARLVCYGHLSGQGWDQGFLTEAPLDFARVPFDHPLWILYSSGTTGLPKAIVHGHGGILLEQLKTAHFHLDARRSDRVFWFTTIGWMMWNYLVGVLLTDASIVLYDGSPTGDRLWNLADETSSTIFGTSAAFISAAMKNNVQPLQGRPLTINAIGSTGSPLPPEAFDWIAERFGCQTRVLSISGGTDVCTAFFAGVPIDPVYRGELQAPALGVRAEAWDPTGHPLRTGTVGDLVITAPMPSMPLFLWADPGGQRLRESYFARYPGVWCHGDWIEFTAHGGAIIHGRSDATINRHGVRIGTSEIYRAVLADADVLDAIVVDLPHSTGDSQIWLFVVLRGAAPLDETRRQGLERRIRRTCSPRHVPDHIVAIDAVPRTLNGKAVEIPIKRILMGARPETAISRATLQDPIALDQLLLAAAWVSAG